MKCVLLLSIANPRADRGTMVTYETCWLHLPSVNKPQGSVASLQSQQSCCFVWVRNPNHRDVKNCVVCKIELGWRSKEGQAVKAAFEFCRNTCKVGEEKIHTPPPPERSSQALWAELAQGNKAELSCPKTECNSSLASKWSTEGISQAQLPPPHPQPKRGLCTCWDLVWQWEGREQVWEQLFKHSGWNGLDFLGANLSFLGLKEESLP